MTLKAGTAVVYITPEKPMFLVGYPHVERTSTGTHDPLLASALYLENGDDSLLMIALDILFLNAVVIRRIRREIAERCGVKAEHLMISCTHTHSGPLTMDMLAFRDDPVVPELDAEYMAFLIERIIEVGVKAANIAKPAEIATTSANVAGVGCNRHDPDGLRDAEAGILLIRDFITKKIEAVSLIYCMHPTVLHEDSKLISSDFPGYTREYLKSHLGKDITVLYHTGPEGNQSPRYDVKGQTFEEAERLGNILGKYVSEAIDNLSEKDFDPNPVINTASKMINPIKRSLPSLKDAEKNLNFRKSDFERLKAENAGHGPIRTAECSVFGAEESLYLAKCAENGSLERTFANYAEIEVQVFRIGSACIVAFPGEMFVEYSLDLKKIFYKQFEQDQRLFAICLANGEMMGYIVTEDATGYEADNSLFMPETGRRMLDATMDLISDLRFQIEK
jgi:neutral/alkaline ceramidase-like enzyme